MEITWLGHSCFILKSDGGVKILTDPPAPDTGYDIPHQYADAVTISHSHFDHNYRALVDAPVFITDAGAHDVKGVAVTGIPAWHDAEHGAKRGANIMYAFDIDGMRILHAGDLGHELDQQQLEAVGHVDVLLIPVGGIYTVDHLQAIAVANQLHTSVVIPMHYATPTSKVDIGRLMPFLTAASNCAIHRMRCNTVVLSPDSLGSDRIITLDYSVPSEE